jgi:hypothetical protein
VLNCPRLYRNFRRPTLSRGWAPMPESCVVGAAFASQTVAAAVGRSFAWRELPLLPPIAVTLLAFTVDHLVRVNG